MKIYGVGRTTDDIQFIYNEKGTCIAKFVIAENVYNYAKKKKKVNFPVVAFGKIAEILGNLNISKGDKIQIEGILDISKYEKDGIKKTYTQIILKSFELCTGKRKRKNLEEIK